MTHSSMNQPLTLREVERQGMVKALATAFGSREEADELLRRIDMPPDELRTFESMSPIYYWTEVCKGLEKGLVAVGIRELLEQAAALRPGNSHFSPWRAPSTQSGAPPVVAAAQLPTPSPASPTTAAPPLPPPLNVFVSYSHKDEAYKDDLVMHLKPLHRERKIKLWTDRDIEASAGWNHEIHTALTSANIVLLLISPAFIASDFCFEQEMTLALKRHDDGLTHVVPIFVKSCDWQKAPFARLQGLPRDARYIASSQDKDSLWTEVAKGIRALVESLLRGGSGQASP